MTVSLPQMLAYAGLGVVLVTAILAGLAWFGMLLGWIPPCRDNG